MITKDGEVTEHTVRIDFIIHSGRYLNENKFVNPTDLHIQHFAKQLLKEYGFEVESVRVQKI